MVDHPLRQHLDVLLNLEVGIITFSLGLYTIVGIASRSSADILFYIKISSIFNFMVNISKHK